MTFKQQIQSPNSIDDRTDYYISFNGVDGLVYGCKTTALVVGQMQGFFIINGDHRDRMGSMDFDQCIKYLNDNLDHINDKSDPIPQPGTTLSQTIIDSDIRIRKAMDSMSSSKRSTD